MRRLRGGIETLNEGQSLIDAQQQAGFDSASGFRKAVGKLLGLPPSELTASSKLCCSWIDTPLGAMLAVADQHSLRLLEFFDRKGLPKALQTLHRDHAGLTITTAAEHPILAQISAELDAYFTATAFTFQTPIHQQGSAFTQSVWDALQNIAAGSTQSYGALARLLGRPGSSRAVARANGANNLAIVIPCHRVIGADGSLTGYGGGLWRKRWLLDHERNQGVSVVA